MSSAVARAKVSRASGPTTALEPNVVVSSWTDANESSAAAASSSSRSVRGALGRGQGERSAGADRAPPHLVVERRAPGLERGAAGELGDDRADDVRLALKLELAEEGDVGDADRCPAGGDLLGGRPVAGDDAPPGAVC